jgi:dynein heavy chain
MTPLSERCFLTITGALQARLGVVMEGPVAGGKTETAKELGRCTG